MTAAEHVAAQNMHPEKRDSNDLKVENLLLLRFQSRLNISKQLCKRPSIEEISELCRKNLKFSDKVPAEGAICSDTFQHGLCRDQVFRAGIAMQLVLQDRIS